MRPLPALSALLVLCLALPARAQEEPAKPTTPPASAEADGLFAAKKYKEAAQAYRKLVEADDKDERSLFRLGYALHASKDYAGALKVYEKALTFPKLKAGTLYNMACAHALLGDKGKALDALEQAVAAGISDRSMIEKDADLDTLRKEERYTKLLEELSKKGGDIYRQFDFWVGDWDVVDAKGNKIGSNVVEMLEGGHLLVENWDNGKGGTGKSMNFVDPVEKKWKQVWVDKGGGVVRYTGEFKDGAMRFTGTSMRKDGSQQLSRMTFNPLADGRVHQHIDHSPDGGKTWQVYFDGFYVRHKPDAGKPPPEKPPGDKPPPDDKK